MKKIFSILIIVAILGIMFTGCGQKRVAEVNDGFNNEIAVDPITGNRIINETMITENIITEDIITESVITWDDVTVGWD